MPSISQLRLRADRVSNQLIELQCDLRGIERRIRILESRAIGGKSRTVSRDLENALLERDGILCNISEAQNALNSLQELIKLHDGHASSVEGSCGGTPSKKRPGALQHNSVPQQPTERSTAGTANSLAHQAGITATQARQIRGVATCRATRCIPNLTTKTASTCSVATSMTSFPPACTEPTQPSANEIDGVTTSSMPCHQTVTKATNALATAAKARSVPNHEPARSPQAAVQSPTMPPTCFHLPLPPQPHELSPPPSPGLSTPPASPTHHTVASSPPQTAVHHALPSYFWPQVPDPSAAVNLWLSAQPDYSHSPHSPASVPSVPARSASPQQVSPIHLSPGQAFPPYFNVQPPHPAAPMLSHPTWYCSPQPASVKPQCSSQAGYAQSSGREGQSHSPVQPPWLHHPEPAFPQSVDPSAADVQKVESWLKAVGKARGWDLQLLDDLLAQDLAAVLASDGPAHPAGDRRPDARHFGHTASSNSIHAWSNPLALQKFVAECAGHPHSARRSGGTADTLVNAVHKHLLRRSATCASHQYSEVLRQSFDLLERGAAISRAYIPASQRNDTHARGPGTLRKENTGEQTEARGHMDRDDSFPGFHQSGELGKAEPVGTISADYGVAQDADSQQQQRDGAWAKGNGQLEAASWTRGLDRESRNGQGTPRGADVRAGRRDCMVDDVHRRGRSIEPQGEAVLTVESSSGEASEERAHASPPAVLRKGGRGIQVAQGRKQAARSKPHLLARKQKEAAALLEDHRHVSPPPAAELPVNADARYESQKPGGDPVFKAAVPSSASPVAAALRPPHSTADVDTALVALAKRVIVQSHRLDLAAREVTKAQRTVPNPLRWAVNVITFFVRVPWPRQARRQECSVAQPEPLARQPATSAVMNHPTSESKPSQPCTKVAPLRSCAGKGTPRNNFDEVRRSHTRVTRSALFRAQAPRILHAIYEDDISVKSGRSLCTE